MACQIKFFEFSLKNFFIIILMYIYKNFAHTFIKIGGASLCQKIQKIIKKETTKKIAKKITTITIITTIDSFFN